MSWHTLRAGLLLYLLKSTQGPFMEGLGRLGKTFHELPSLEGSPGTAASPLARAPCGALTVTPGPGMSCRLRTTTISGLEVPCGSIDSPAFTPL